MTNQLPIPPELQHLIEKRSGKDRRKSTSRTGDPAGPDTSAHSLSSEPLTKPPESQPDGLRERRSGKDRRRSTS